MDIIGRQHYTGTWTMERCYPAGIDKYDWKYIRDNNITSRRIKLNKFQPPVVSGTFKFRNFYSYRSSSGVVLEGDDGNRYYMLLGDFGDILRSTGFKDGIKLTLAVQKKGVSVLWSLIDPKDYDPCDDYEDWILAAIHEVDLGLP